MRVAKLVQTSIARPGVETYGKVAGPRDIERTIREQLGARKVFSLLPPISDKWAKGPLKYFEWLVKFFQNGSQMRELLNKIPEHIKLAGIKSKFVVDKSLEFDPDCPNERIPYDPVTDMGVTAIKRLLAYNAIDPSQIGSFYLATTTANSFDPPPATRILAKLIRDKIVPRKVIEGNGTTGWKVRGIAEGCVGSIITLEQIERDMKSRLLDEPNDRRFALAVFAAALFECADNDGGNLIIADEQLDTREIDKLIHPLRKFSDLPIHQRLLRYLRPSSNYLASKRVAKNIADRGPNYLLSLASKNGFHLWDFDHIVLSQTSKGVIDRVEFGLAEKIREGLLLDPNIRPELKALIDEIAKESSFTLLKEKDLLTTNLFRIIENDRWTELMHKMNKNEIELMNYMILIHQTIVRTYPSHSYTGVASIPMAIAQGVIDKKVNLEEDSIAMVASGLCGRIKGAIVDNKIVKNAFSA